MANAAITHDPILVDLALQGGGSHGALAPQLGFSHGEGHFDASTGVDDFRSSPTSGHFQLSLACLKGANR
jgi:hypothetical protein